MIRIVKTKCWMHSWAMILGCAAGLFLSPALNATETIEDFEVLALQMRAGNYNSARDGFTAAIESLLEQRGFLSEQPAVKTEPAQLVEQAGNQYFLHSQIQLFIDSWIESEARSTLVDEAKAGQVTTAKLNEIVPYIKRLESFIQETAAIVTKLEEHILQQGGGASFIRLIEQGNNELLALFQGAARLAKVNGNPDIAADLFQQHPKAFDQFPDAASYLDWQEDYYQRYQIPDENKPAATPSPTRADPDTETEMQAFLEQFHQALAGRDTVAIQGFLADDSSWTANALIQAMDMQGMSGFGSISELEVHKLPDGTFRSRVKEVPFKFFDGSQEEIRSGAQTLTLIEEEGGWKILELGK